MVDDAELVERVRRGDREAFGGLVQRYQRRAFAVAWRFLRQREDAEDVVQESFLAALDKLDSFDATRPFGPWFLRIVANRSMSQLDRARVRATDPLHEEIAPASGGVEADFDRGETAALVRDALAELSERQRLVMQWHELDGLATAEIAEALGITESTVRWTVHAGRKALRERLLARQEGPDA